MTDTLGDALPREMAQGDIPSMITFYEALKGYSV